VATHNPAIVDAMRRRVIALRRGRIYLDTPEGGYPDDLGRG
jgi:ABC-type ATPase involved in cell division